MTQQRVSPIAVTSLLPATPVLSLTAASGQSANLVTLNNSSGTALATISAAGLATFPNVAVSSTTIPANGIYLPAANTLGFATNSAVRMQINASGEIATGASPSAGIGLQLLKNITGATASYVINSIGFVQSDVTSSATYYRTFARTANSNFSISSISHYDASAVSTFDNVTAGGSITAQYGFRVTNGLIGATSNYGFYGDIASGTNRWNFYANGTAANYFAGQTTVGSTSLTLGSSSAAQQFGVVIGAATSVGAVVRAATSQSANLQEWQDSSGTAMTWISATGGISLPRGSTFRFNAGIGVERAQITSNTANDLIFGTAGGTEIFKLAGGATPGGATLTVGTASAIGLIVKGAASQTGNLQEWQNSGGTVLAKVDASGNMTANTFLTPVAAVTTPITAATHSIGTADTFVVYNTSATCTVTLPTASSFTGRVLYLKTIAAQAINSNASNVKPAGSNTAGTAILTNTAGKWAILVSDGTNWVIMAAN